MDLWRGSKVQKYTQNRFKITPDKMYTQYAKQTMDFSFMFLQFEMHTRDFGGCIHICLDFYSNNNNQLNVSVHLCKNDTTLCAQLTLKFLFIRSHLIANSISTRNMFNQLNLYCVCECVQTNRSTANIIQIFYFVFFLGSSFISCVFHKKWETENQTLNGATYWTTNEFLFIVYPFRLPRFAFSLNKRGRYCNRAKKSSKAVSGKTSRKNQSSVCDTTWSVFSLQFQMFA